MGEGCDVPEEANRPWTSTLSVKEWAALSELRLTPLGPVMGSSFYHLGQTLYQGYYDQSVRLHSIESGFNECRGLAVARLRQEARALGADAVVGMKIRKKVTDYFSREHEFIAMGTAVKWKGLPPSAEPYLCTVTGQDLVKLLAAGSLPVGVVMGISIYYLSSLDEPGYIFDFTNREMKFYTRQVYEARQNAVRQLTEQCRQLEADGVLAGDTSFTVHEVEVEAQNQKRIDRVIEFVSYGTAIREVRTQATAASVVMVKLLNR
jgi:uncharacterized protein YbjQ (UPF0145 family)